jgi:hypothetical protein
VGGEVELDEDAEMTDRFWKRTKDVSHDVNLKIQFTNAFKKNQLKYVVQFLTQAW